MIKMYIFKNIQILGPDENQDFKLKADIYDENSQFIISTPSQGLSFAEFMNTLPNDKKQSLTLQYSQEIIEKFIKEL
jgi:hypothetical protein